MLGCPAGRAGCRGTSHWKQRSAQKACFPNDDQSTNLLLIFRRDWTVDGGFMRRQEGRLLFTCVAHRHHPSRAENTYRKSTNDSDPSVEPTLEIERLLLVQLRPTLPPKVLAASTGSDLLKRTASGRLVLVWGRSQAPAGAVEMFRNYLGGTLALTSNNRSDNNSVHNEGLDTLELLCKAPVHSR